MFHVGVALESHEPLFERGSLELPETRHVAVGWVVFQFAVTCKGVVTRRKERKSTGEGRRGIGVRRSSDRDRIKRDLGEMRDKTPSLPTEKRQFERAK